MEARRGQDASASGPPRWLALASAGGHPSPPWRPCSGARMCLGGKPAWTRNPSRVGRCASAGGCASATSPSAAQCAACASLCAPLLDSGWIHPFLLQSGFVDAKRQRTTAQSQSRFYLHSPDARKDLSLLPATPPF